jgi:hypothetical protein
MEEKILQKLDEISKRLEALENKEWSVENLEISGSSDDDKEDSKKNDPRIIKLIKNK